MRDDSSHVTYTKRWFAYFDLLGFRDLVLNSRIDTVLSIYDDVLDVVVKKSKRRVGQDLFYSWFSDTFIIFTSGCTDREFVLIEKISRTFFRDLILEQIPVRGALTVGNLYYQQERNIVIGDALIDAYEYGEKQNWLGFILTPSVYAHFKGTSMDLELRTFYRRVNEKNIITHQYSDDVFAYAFNFRKVNGKDPHLIHGENPFRYFMRIMMSRVDERYVKKYTNSIKFIEQHNGKPP